MGDSFEDITEASESEDEESTNFAAATYDDLRMVGVDNLLREQWLVATWASLALREPM